MTDEQSKIRNFMLQAEQDCPLQPTWPETDYLKDFRRSLIQEELNELEDSRNLVELADAIGDLMYVVIGTAIAYGIDMEPIFNEIHRSNMTKFIDGHKNHHGKWIKGPSYSPANLKPIIDAQLGIKSPSEEALDKEHKFRNEQRFTDGEQY